MKYKNNKKSIILIVLILLIVLITVMGLSYAIFFYKKEGRVKNVIGTRAIQCTFNEGAPIYITSAFPISDEVGKKLTSGVMEGYEQGYYDVTLSCECKGTCRGNYEIYASNTSTNPKLNEEYVMTYVTDGKEVERELTPVTKFSDLTTSSDEEGKVIYRGSFSESFSQKIRLRIWISEDYSIDEQSKTFKAKLNAKVNE